MQRDLDPGHILQVGLGFFAAKALQSAVELELHTVLGAGGMTGPQLGDRLGLHPRGLFDFLDALVALRLLARDGDGPHAVYRNTPETAAFLDKASPRYLGGIFEMASARLYPFWGHLTRALRTGLPQNELREGGPGLFEVIYADEAKLEQFLRGMQGIQLGNFQALADRFDFGRYRTFCDVGGGNGTLAAVVARRHPGVACKTFDLPVVAPVARRHVAAWDADRVEVLEGDFFRDPLPAADVIAMGNILHDWDEQQKLALLRKARAALPPGGVFIAIENVIDDARRENAFGLLMSLNMLIELPGGFDYTGAQFHGWARAAGFQRTEVMPLTGPTSAAIAYA